MKLLKYNQYKFLKENFEYISDYQHLNEDNFMQFAGGPAGSNLLGGEVGSFGFAVDPSISIYSQQDSPYTSGYYASAYFVNKVIDIMKSVYKGDGDYGNVKFDHFLDDIDDYTNLKILRIVPNQNLSLDVYISFMFHDDEFFGVYKNFNGLQKPTLKSDIFTDRKYNYIDLEYSLKLDNYLFRLITNWFKPSVGFYDVLNDIVPCKNEMGESIELKKGQIVKVLGKNNGKDRKPYISMEYKGEILYLVHNNYFFFNYWFEKKPEMKF